MSTIRPAAPARRRGGGHATVLVVARHALDEQLALALQSRTGPASLPWLAWAPLVLQPTREGVQALTGELRAGAPPRLPVTRAGLVDTIDPLGLARTPAGLLLLYVASDGELPPDEADGHAAHDRTAAGAWEAWLVARVPDYRLACTALVPTVAVLWLREDGRATAVLRLGEDWAAVAAGVEDPGAPDRLTRWQAFDDLALPGPQMLHMAIKASGLVTFAADPTSTGHDAEAADLDGRYSRQSAALGPQVLQRLQRSKVAVVGAGRTGSVLAHSLARMGCNLLVIDPDDISPHSLDGDHPPFMEGRPKVEGVQRLLRGLLRPGASVDVRRLPIASPVAGALLVDCDIVCCCVDNDAARLWANAWALALLKPLLVVAVDIHDHGAEAELRLLPPGCGCLACVGGFAQFDLLGEQLALSGPPTTPDDVRQQRRGSLRSWGVLAVHAGLRMVEQMVDGRLRGARFRRLAESEQGGLQVADAAPDGSQRLGCQCCAQFAGVGLAGVRPQALADLVIELRGRAFRPALTQAPQQRDQGI